MPDYRNGKIYQIVSDLTDKIYIGCSTTTLQQRFTAHRNNYTSSAHVLFDAVGVENCRIELLLNYPCNTYKELKHTENVCLHMYGDIAVNKDIPYRGFIPVLRPPPAVATPLICRRTYTERRGESNSGSVSYNIYT